MKMETQYLTPECTIVWPSLFEPESFNNDEEKFRAVLLFDESTDFTGMQKAIVAAMCKKFPGKEKVFYAGLRTPIRDGAEKAVNENGNANPDSIYYGHKFMSVKSNFKPQVVDLFNQTITDPKVVYGGCRVVALVNFYAYDHLGNRGVSCALQALMKMADGKPIGGGKVDTAQAFAGLIQKASPQAMLNSSGVRNFVNENLDQYYTTNKTDDIRY